MALVVQKFGGTSVADVDRIRSVAERVAASRARGDQVVVVVSAMAGETNRLLGLARAIAPSPDDRESDALVATGEQVTAALAALALQEVGVPARSFLGHQVRIETDSAYGRARIVRVDVERLQQTLAAGTVAVVAGFQGVDGEGRITTLGRGGSDTSAVALAAALGAEACEIYTDVDGVFTSDPRVVKSARKLTHIQYDEMLELAAVGARVMHPRAVAIGELYGVPIHVRSSFRDGVGTMIVAHVPMEDRQRVRGIAQETHVAKITVVRARARPGLAAAIFEPLSEAGISVDVIVQHVSTHGKTDLTFTV